MEIKVEVYEQRVLIPEEGHYLYNAEAGVVSDKVYLGKQADASAWVEITEGEKDRIEEQQSEELENAENFDDIEKEEVM